MTILEFLGFGLAMLFLLSCFMLLRAGIKIVVNDKMNKSEKETDSPAEKPNDKVIQEKGVIYSNACKYEFCICPVICTEHDECKHKRSK